MLSEIRQRQTNTHYVHDLTQTWNCGFQGRGVGKWGVCVYADRVSVWEDEKVLQVDGGNGYTTKRLYLILLNCIHKND